MVNPFLILMFCLWMVILNLVVVLILLVSHIKMVKRKLLKLILEQKHLLQFALDDDVKAKEQDEVAHSILKKAPSLQKNQLPQGVYQIGKDIPIGTFDFHHVWGNGNLELYSSEDTTLGNLKFSQWIGDRYDYELLDCINVRCEESWYLHVKGNLIVEIKRSKDVEIDL